MKHQIWAAVISGCLVASGHAAVAQGAGEVEFMQACASCHGADGRGTGPLSEILTVPVPDVTTIAARNDGVFPMLDVIHTIDGRMETTGHGFPMPVWGDRYAAEVGASAGTFGAELVVRGRVLALATYLESIQE